MTLYADDPDVHIVYSVDDKNGGDIDFTPVVKVDGFNDITAMWVAVAQPHPSKPGWTVRYVRVPLYGLPAGVVLRLRLVVPGDNDIEFKPIAMDQSSPDWEWPGQPGAEYYTKAEIDALLEGIGGGGSDALTIVNGGTVVLADDLPEGTLVGYRVKATTTFTATTGEAELAPGAYTFERTAADWTYYAAEAGTPLGSTPPVTEAPDVTVDDPAETSAVVTWTAVDFAEGYVIRLDGGAWLDLGNILTYTVTGLLPGTDHTVDVAGYNAATTTYVPGSAEFSTDAVADTATYDYFEAPDGTSIARAGAPLTYAFTGADMSAFGIGDELAIITKNMVADGSYGAAWDWPDANGRLTVYLHGHVNSVIRLRGRGTRIQFTLNSTTASSVSENTAGDNPIGSIPGVIGGFLTLELIGTTGKVFWNGAQVGSSFTAPTASGVRWGFATQRGIHIDAIKMETVTGTPGAPTMLMPSHYAPGSVITSETFGGSDTMTNAGAGGVARLIWPADGTDYGYTKSGGLMVPGSNASSMVCAGQPDHEIEATLAVAPTTAGLRLMARRTIYGADETSRGYYKLQVTSSALTPMADIVTPGLTGAVSFGAPQAGDVYSIKAIGTTLTFTAKRSNGDPIGVGTQTFTVAKPLSDNGWDVGVYCEAGFNGRLSQYRVLAR